MAEGKRTFNPIDPDKIAEEANLLPYGSSVSAPAFKAVETLKNKSLDVNDMEMQTDINSQSSSKLNYWLRRQRRFRHERN